LGREPRGVGCNGVSVNQIDNQQLSPRDVELAVKTLIDYMADTLAEGGRIEIRGFGSFSLHFRAPRVGRNPKTGASVKLHGKYVPHFKSGKELRERVNDSMFDASSGTHGDDKRNADDAPGEAVNG
jgi:integration host factor subunit beta